MAKEIISIVDKKISIDISTHLYFVMSVHVTCTLDLDDLL